MATVVSTVQLLNTDCDCAQLLINDPSYSKSQSQSIRITIFTNNMERDVKSPLLLLFFHLLEDDNISLFFLARQQSKSPGQCTHQRADSQNIM